MKPFLILLVLLSSLSANAVIFTTSSHLYCEMAVLADYELPEFRPLATVVYCGISTTTSLPTLILEGQEMDLNSDEVSIRLVAEAHGDAEAVLSSKIAQDLKIETSSVLEAVLSLEEINQEVSVEAVLSEIGKQ